MYLNRSDGKTGSMRMPKMYLDEDVQLISEKDLYVVISSRNRILSTCLI